MKTRIHPSLAPLPEVGRSEEILRRCVHCGFCNATCPTYQELGDELDGPRGRIYLIKNLLETGTIEPEAVTHLDRCLTCRACETTCPSGVQYGELLDTGRALAEPHASRPLLRVLVSGILRVVIPRRWLLAPLLKMGQFLRPVLPGVLKDQVPASEQARYGTQPSTAAGVLLLTGCVQSAATPNVVSSLQRILAVSGVTSALVDEGCCGALDYHLSAHEAAKVRMKQVIELLEPRLDEVDAILSSATGCGVTITEYDKIFQHDPLWRDRAARVAGKVQDAVSFVENLPFRSVHASRRVAVHTPCSMQHGMQLVGRIEQVLARLGFELVAHTEGHLCCGSAGTYSILEPAMSKRLKDRKLRHLTENQPDVIVTANIGCQLHLGSGADIPVMHWLELVAEVCQPSTTPA